MSDNARSKFAQIQSEYKRLGEAYEQQKQHFDFAIAKRDQQKNFEVEQFQTQMFRMKTEDTSKTEIIAHLREQLKLREDAFQKLQKDYHSQNSSEVAKSKVENHELQKELSKRDIMIKELKVSKYNVRIFSQS